MTGRGREIADVMNRRKIDILCVQETRWAGKSARDLGGDCNIFFSGSPAKRNGVGVIVRGEYKDKVLVVKRYNDRLMTVKFVMKSKLMSVISV